MSDILVLCNVSAVCQDGIVREGGSLVVRDGEYVFLDENGAALENDCSVIELKHGVTPMDPGRLSMITAKYGPILS